MALSDAQHGRADARADQSVRVAGCVVEEAGSRAAEVARHVAQAPELARALQDGDRRRLERALVGLATREGLVRPQLTPAGGGDAVGVQPRCGRPVVPALVGRDGSAAGELRVATETLASLTRDVTRFTGVQARTDRRVPVAGAGAPGRRAAHRPRGARRPGARGGW